MRKRLSVPATPSSGSRSPIGDEKLECSRITEKVRNGGEEGRDYSSRLKEGVC